VPINPFTYGNPISDPARFFGREREIEQVFSRLRNAEFESSSLVGERRVGKTSLLKTLAHPDVRHQHGLDSNQYIFVYVDLQMLDKDATPQKLWQHMLRQMARYCEDAEVKQTIEQIRKDDQVDTFALADLFDDIDEKKQFVVFLLDEFENVTTNQNFGPDFFYGLRSLAIHHNLALVTSSRKELIELCHSNAVRSSPFFNIFANINVNLFQANESLELIEQSLKGTDVMFNPDEINVLSRLAGYHPYFLQAACYFLFEAYSKNLSHEERLKHLHKEFREEANPHLADYWHSSDDQEKIVLTVLALLDRKGKANGRSFSMGQLQEYYARSDQTLSHLEKRSLITVQAEGYGLFSSLWGDWIMSEITNIASDSQSYDEWLKSNQNTLEKLSSKAKGEISEILPKISSKYRDLIVSWASDPKNWVAVVTLLKGVLFSG
jgi:AAA+ ATPase superfamily predicted ATPase